MHLRSARAKAVQNVRRGHPRWRDMARALSRARKLSSTSRAAAQSTRIPGTDPARLGSTACASASLMALPTASTGHRTESARVTEQSAASDTACYPRHAARSKRIALVHSDHRGQLARSSSTRPPPGSPRPLNRPPTAPWWFSASGRRLQVDLERSAVRRPILQPIVMMPMAPPRRDHLLLTGRCLYAACHKMHSCTSG